MKLSTRVRYAVRAVIDLGVHSRGNLVLLKDIAKRQEVSIKYLENIFASLRNAGIVKGIRGAKGGYTLTRDPRQINIFDIVYAMQGFISPIGCADDSCACSRAETCDSRPIWIEVTEAITRVLKQYSLQDLIERHQADDASVGPSAGLGGE